jgi:circadian clock protein KaiC
MEDGLITVREVNPAEISPGEFARVVRTAAEDGAKVVIIDSLNGYLNAMPDERHLTIHLHELLAYLGQKNVATFLIGAQQGLVDASMGTPADSSYLADSIILLRYFEAQSAVRQAISVVKKRGGGHDRSIRELVIEPGRIRIGEPLLGFRGVLQGFPEYSGDGQALVAKRSRDTR